MTISCLQQVDFERGSRRSEIRNLKSITRWHLEHGPSGTRSVVLRTGASCLRQTAPTLRTALARQIPTGPHEQEPLNKSARADLFRGSAPWAISLLPRQSWVSVFWQIAILDTHHSGLWSKSRIKSLTSTGSPEPTLEQPERSRFGSRCWQSVFPWALRDAQSVAR